MSFPDPSHEVPGASALDLDALKVMLQDASPSRVVVATDWSRPTAAYAVLRAFAAALDPGAPAHLVFAVPHEPAEEDLRCVQVLLEEAEIAHELAGISVESFPEVVGQPYDLSVVALGDRDVLALEIADAVTRLFAIARGDVAPGDRNCGDLDALARRLGNYSEADAAAVSRQAAAAAAQALDTFGATRATESAPPAR